MVVTIEILSGTPTPLLSVPSRCPFRHHPLRQWGGPRPTKNKKFGRRTMEESLRRPVRRGGSPGSW